MADEQNYPFPQIAMQESGRDNLVMQTSPERIAELMEHHLRGELWSDEDKKWAKPEGKTALMNDIGVDEVMVLVKFFMNQNATLANVNEKMLSVQVIGFARSLAKAFAINTKRWELSTSIRTPLVYSIVATIFNTLTRSLGKTISDKELYQGTIQSREVIQLREMQNEKRGFWNKITGSSKQPPSALLGGKY